jgi:hypothetical protein
VTAAALFPGSDCPTNTFPVRSLLTAAIFTNVNVSNTIAEALTIALAYANDPYIGFNSFRRFFSPIHLFMELLSHPIHLILFCFPI